jgi:hypothetical protein
VQSQIKAWLRGIIVATCTKFYKYYRSSYIFEKPKCKKKKKPKKHKRIKIRLSKVTNAQKKVVKEKKNIQNEINNKNCEKKKKAKKLRFI